METYDLIEASKSFFTYQPILRTLQTMENVPLSDQIVSLQASGPQRVPYLPTQVGLPSDNNFRGTICNLEDWSSTRLTETTSLDISQAKALHHALTSPVSLVQGPPGTGKTFIGALIARVIRENSDKSILCVCYTNHALDQFLEHMLDAGEQRIVRIGGRSKSERLAGYQLRDLTRHKSSLRDNDSRRLKQVDAQMYGQRDTISDIITTIRRDVGWKSPNGGIRHLLRTDYPDLYELFSVPMLADGFNMVGADNKTIQGGYLWNAWRKGASFPPSMEGYLRDTDSKGFQEFWAMPRYDRQCMIDGWRKEILRSESQELHSAVESFSELNREKTAILQEKDLQILRDARVIGATTTGAAQYHELLCAKACGVVVVEEAGEVLEAHVLTASRKPPAILMRRNN